MANLNKKCFCCGEQYSFCPDCSNADKLAPSWKSEFCSESCMSLWSTLTKFGMKKLDKVEAKSIISALDLKPIESYASCVQKDYAIVMAEDKKARRSKRIEIKPIDEIVDIEPTIIEDAIEESIAIEESHEVVTIENE